MSGLFHSLNIGSESLFASRQGVDTAGHNIANAQTEGFSRQRVNLETRAPSETRGVVIGNGVFVKNISRAHDSFLEKQLNDTHQEMGHSTARFDSLKPLENIYSPELGNGISAELDKFYNSLQDLSNFPEELPVRTGVRESAQNVVNAFRHTDESLKVQRDDINNRIQGEVQEASGMIADIANLNIAIKGAETSSSKEVPDLMDQQDKILRELTKKMDISYYRGDQNMVVVRGPSETLLVDRGEAARMDVARSDDKSQFDIVVLDGAAWKPTIVTHDNKKGRLAGMIEVRDKVIPNLLEDNNKMATAFAGSMNAIHRQGFGLKDYKETTGRDFFEIKNIDNAAATLALDSRIVESTNAISVAASPNAPGDNVLANKMIRVKDEKIMGDASLGDYYANYVGVFGLDLQRSQQTKEADDTLIRNLNSRRDAISGVSMDEEATNLLKWQANFTASSKVITTVDEMIETVLQMKR
ncbi:MAG: flagellar hook-associated protein FlgK [Chitinophagaceae bacterium]|nr:flagellar hook-associated protein FlgK [Oligoflexus sp.]